MHSKCRASAPSDTRGANAGFTLIEIIVAIGLLSLMMVWLLGGFRGAQETTKINQTEVLLQDLAARAESYCNQRRFGDYPPDDFRDPLGKYQVTPDNVNSGIESFLAFLAREDSRDASPTDMQTHFSNFDKDKSETALGRLDTNEKFEVKDAFGTPIAYFHRRNYDKGGQTYRDESGEDQEVRPWRRKDGKFYNPRSFQLISAGPDRIFNTDDDIGHDFPQQEQ